MTWVTSSSISLARAREALVRAGEVPGIGKIAGRSDVRATAKRQAQSRRTPDVNAFQGDSTMTFRPAFIAAPVLVMGYGIVRLVDGLDGVRGPGPAWTIGHLAFLGALIAFISVFWQMRRMAGGRALATVCATAGTLGALALITQFSIDLAAGSAGHRQLRHEHDHLRRAHPARHLTVGLRLRALRLLSRPARARRPARCAAPGQAVDAGPGAGRPRHAVHRQGLIPLGSALLLVSFLPLARGTAAAVTPAQPVPALA